MRKLLIWASTADPAILSQCPGERIRYEAMGAAIITTASIAAVSAAFAASMAPRLWAPIALVAGIAILNIDRMLVGGVHRRETTFGNIAAAFPRVVLALLIGPVVSTRLSLKVRDRPARAVDAKKAELQQGDVDVDAYLIPQFSIPRQAAVEVP
jgi:hypothetical protein